MKLGQRVFVAGPVGRYGKLTAITRGFYAPQYMVWLDGDAGHSGPFTEVWPGTGKPWKKAASK